MPSIGIYICNMHTANSSEKLWLKDNLFPVSFLTYLVSKMNVIQYYHVLPQKICWKNKALMT
jgi:hypothetical protein